MDARIETLAKNLVNYSCKVKEGEKVYINYIGKETENLAKAIFEDIKYSKLSLAAIARKYNVKDSLVYDINRCRTWKHLHSYKTNIRNEFRKEGDAK